MSFPRYPRYKDSGVEWLGEVPEHWSVSRLGFESWVRARLGWKGLKAEEYVDDGFAFLSTPNIKGSMIDFENVNFITQERFDESPEIKLRKGDVLLAKDGSTLGTVNVVRDLPRPTTVNSSIAVITPNASLNSLFLHYLFACSYIEQTIQRTKGGMGVPHLFQSDLNKFYIPLPDHAEQIRITTFLDWETAKIDESVKEQERLIKLLKEKRQAVISHAVTKGLNPKAPMKPSGIEWLGDVPENWEVVGMTKYLASVVDYRGRTPTKVDEGIFLLTARNIRDGKLDYAASEEFIAPIEYEDAMRRGKPELGDVLFTTEAPLGQVANIDRTDVALAQRVIKFRGQPDILNNYFLKYWLMGSFAQADMERLATGSTALGIKGSKVVQLRLCLPPHDEQREIVAFLDIQLAKLDVLTPEAQRAIDLLQERRTALISAAVTGQIDVRPLLEKKAA